MSLTLVTGAVDSGKTTWCRRTAAPPGWDGLLLPKVFDPARAAGQVVGYDCERLATGQRLPFARLQKALPPGWSAGPGVGPFSISRQGLDQALRWGREALEGEAPGLVFDEIGPLELRGEGLAPLLPGILAAADTRRVLLVVRRACLAEVRRVLGLGSSGLAVQVVEPG